MPSSYYDDDNSEDSSKSQANSNGKDDGDESNSEDKGETLFPKSILGNRECKPGEKLTFEVTHVYEDEVSAKFVGYKDGKDKSGDKEDKKSDDESDDMKHSINELEGSYA